MDDPKTTSVENKTRSKFNLFEFVRETRREIAKVTWPTRKETVMTTVLIVCMAMIFGVFFLGIDTVLGFSISRILGMRGS